MTKRPTAAHCRRVPKWPTLALGRLRNNNLFGEESMARATLAVSHRSRRLRSVDHRRRSVCANAATRFDSPRSGASRSCRAAILADRDDHHARLSRCRACRPHASRCELAGRQEGASAAGDARNHAMGLVRQCPAAGAAGPFRRHHRDGNDDAQPQSGGSGRRPSSKSRSCAPISPVAGHTH